MATCCAPACSQALPVKPQGVWARGSEAWAGSRDLRNLEFVRWAQVFRALQPNELMITFLVVCSMCFDRLITILLQKSLTLSAMIWGSLVLTLEMLETEYSGFGDEYHACWCPGLSRQGISRLGIDSIGYATCGVAPLEIWSSSVEQNPTYDMKYEFIYYDLKTIRRVRS